MRQQRIAIITPYGAEQRFDNYAEFILAQTLRERGWNARMYTYAMRDNPAYAQDIVYKTVPVFRCRQRYGISPRLFFSIVRFCPRTVVCFHPKSYLNFTAYWAARFIRARFIVEIVGILHDPYIVNNVDDPENNLKKPIRLVTDISSFVSEFVAKRIHGLWTNYVYHMPTASADAIISINNDEQRYVKKIYNRSSVRIYWSTPRYIAPRETKPEKTTLGNFLFFIGQIKRRKGWDTVIDALALLKESGSNRRLVFVTPHHDTSEPEEYALKRNVLDRINFLTAISNEEKNWLYAHCDYVIVPSTYEGFGLPVFEAFLAGKPLCATTINVFLEFLEDRRNALLFPPGDAQALAEAIRTLDNSEELRRKLIEEGKRTAKEFNYVRMVDAYVALFEGG